MNIRVACIQLDAGNDFERNFRQTASFIRRAARKHVSLVVFPETFLFRGSSTKLEEVARKTSAIIPEFQRLAKGNKIAVLLGSILEVSPVKNRYFNTSLFISEKGEIKAKYRKIHLFDVRTPKGARMKESEHIVAGKKIVSRSWRGIRVGFSICYDVRFPELFRALVKRGGAEVIFVPSNFLEETGEVHWHALLRARAIENQVFIVAPAQSGKNVSTGKRSFGHSLVIDPWGCILAEASGSGERILVADLDLSFLHRIRKNFPVVSR